MSIIIYPPTIDWGWMKQRPQHLMSQLAKKGHHVYFCNKTQTRQAMQEIEPNLFLVHHHRDWLEHTWPGLRQTYGETVGVWSTLPSQASEITIYSPDWVVYDCVDEFAEWHRYEQDMVRLSTCIVCTSERLYERLRRTYPGMRIEMIRNAYDEQMNLHLPPPALGGQEEECREWNEDKELMSSDTKRIGYIGAWAPWVDELLIKKLSLLGNAQMIVIGPEYGKKYDIIGRSHHVRFLGLKPHCLLPGYIRRLSVCIIPFLITPVTLATNPVKAYEYLAAGKPVVSTNMPECRLMSPHIDVADNHEQFIDAVIRRLRDPGDGAARTAYALEHTWTRRGEQVQRLLATF
ncbi:glycosyltransferase [Paenibacillus doosanensis]|uniref:glycosyltransferase n=1 Tax=Paenibacillus doosanensis TaxID=1229154 RepID=UPI0021808BC6|nr:glycosyltransferase [Paenibacillus doosanensis]MCS7458849.1 glycosyltransferase [Paenibacillus doosanensis]